jgi:1-acyl-sn-glycerol-3-phosphate acyltransferase
VAGHYTGFWIGYTRRVKNRLTDLFGHPAPVDPNKDRMDMALVERVMDAIGKLAPWHRPELHGLDHIPRNGPALMVGNHGLMGADAPYMWHGIYKGTGRVVRGLGDDILFSTPLLVQALHRLGAVHGTPENGLALLKAGHLVNVYPGGALGALKRKENSYRLHWERARGFVRLAMRARAPVVLHMCCGSDDTFFNLGRLRFPARVMGNPKYEVPWLIGLGPLPLPAKLDYYISEAILLEGGPDGAEDKALVERHHAMLWRLGEEMLQEGLRRRKSVYFS